MNKDYIYNDLVYGILIITPLLLFVGFMVNFEPMGYSGIFWSMIFIVVFMFYANWLIDKFVTNGCKPIKMSKKSFAQHLKKRKDDDIEKYIEEIQ